MARYRGRHSSRERERQRNAPVNRLSRQWAGVAAVGLAILVAGVIALTGGWEEAVRTFTGEELKEQEAELRSELESGTPGASETAEPASP